MTAAGFRTRNRWDLWRLDRPGPQKGKQDAGTIRETGGHAGQSNGRCQRRPREIETRYRPLRRRHGTQEHKLPQGNDGQSRVWRGCRTYSKTLPGKKKGRGYCSRAGRVRRRWRLGWLSRPYSQPLQGLGRKRPDRTDNFRGYECRSYNG